MASYILPLSCFTFTAYLEIKTISIAIVVSIICSFKAGKYYVWYTINKVPKIVIY